MAYRLPEDRTWVPLKIVSAQVETKTMRIVEADEVVEVDVPLFRVKSIHVATQYGARPFPYRNVLPARAVVLPYNEPRAGKLGYPVASGPTLMKAAGLNPELFITPEDLATAASKMVGAIVMGLVTRRVKVATPGRDGEMTDTLYDGFTRVPDRHIEVITTDGPQPATIPWDSVAAFLHDPDAGALGEVVLDSTGRTVSVCRVGSHWEEHQADVRDHLT